MDLIASTDRGLYCAAGDFHIDPWRPVARAIITHAHSDHARFGSEVYVCHRDTAPILRKRLGDVTIETAAYGEILTRNGVELSFHPAGHVLGSAQIRVAHRTARSGSPRATTSSRATAFRPPSSRCAVTPSSPSRPSACRSTAGARKPRSSPRSTPGGARTSPPGARAFSTPMRSARRSALLAHVDPAIGPDRLPRRDRGDQRALSRGGRRPAADPSRRREIEQQARVRPRAHRCAAVGRREPLAQALRRLFRRAGERLDAGARQPPPARARPRLCAVRPRRLAGPHRRHRGDRRGAHSRDPRIGRRR